MANGNGNAGEGNNGNGLGGLVQQFQKADAFYFTEFTELNESGVSGGAIVFVNDGEATVVAAASGVEGGGSHAMHVHGFGGDKDSEVPTLAADADDDGFIELAEGATTYGPIQQDISPGVTGDSFFYVQSFDFNDDTANGDLTADNLDQHEIVLHGMTLDEGDGSNGGEADGTAGYKAFLPIAAGELVEFEPDGVSDLAMLRNLVNGDMDDHMLG